MSNTVNTPADFINNIDWAMLSKQKQTLLRVIDTDVSPQDVEQLEGILMVINAVQDMAVDFYGVDSDVVFHRRFEIDGSIYLGNKEDAAMGYEQRNKFYYKQSFKAWCDANLDTP